MPTILNFVFILSVFVSTYTYTQTADTLSAIERAYLFHSVKKTPIFERHIGAYFNYIGEMVAFSNGEPDYDSIEKKIIADPTLLEINTYELSKSPRGIISELSNKLVVWELNKMLHVRQIKETDFDQFKELFQDFEKILLKTLPSSALENNNGNIIVLPRVYNVLNPNLSLNEKIGQLNAIQNLSPNDELQIIQALFQAVNIYVDKQTQRIFRALGGQFYTIHNVLTRAGEGKTSSDVFNDRQKDESIFWNKGLPKAIGLFAYELQLKQAEHVRQKPKMEAMFYTTTDWETVGENKKTKLHFDVWGYNPDNQIMVVIEKHGKTYPLFSSGKTRFLSPDSTFSGEKTFQQLIDELKNVKIAELTEKIEGKEGYDAQIIYHNEQKNETELKIVKSEKKFSDLGYATITTSKKASHKAKKAKKQAVLRGVGADNWDANPTTKSKKKQKGKSQNTIIDLYQQFEWHKKKIKELEKEKEIAIDLRARYQLQLDQYLQIQGYSWIPYTEKNGLYTFSDSCTFDLYTQDFHFPTTIEKEMFEIRLVAIPDSISAKTAQPVMLHATLLDVQPNEDARINASFIQEVNAKNIFSVENVLLKNEDSIAIRQFFANMLDKEQSLEIEANGCGVGVWNGTQVVKDSPQIPPQYYFEQFEFVHTDIKDKNLWWTEILFFFNSYNRIIVNTFMNKWDEVPNVILNKKLTKIKNKNKLSKEEMLTAQRTANVIKTLRSELISLSGRYLSMQEATTIVKRIDNLYKDINIKVGKTMVSLSYF